MGGAEKERLAKGGLKLRTKMADLPIPMAVNGVVRILKGVAWGRMGSRTPLSKSSIGACCIGSYVYEMYLSLQLLEMRIRLILECTCCYGENVYSPSLPIAVLMCSKEC